MRAQDLVAALEAVAPAWPPALRAAVAASGAVVPFTDGRRLFAPGDECRGFLIVLDGAVRVEHSGPTGRTVVLYRIGPGESCVMTTACLLGGGAYGAWGYAEGDGAALALARPAFATLMGESAQFRAYALDAFATRIRELVEVIDELLLRRVDLRLADWLSARGPRIGATHQAVAAEIGAAREVVSRVLKEFERRGWVALGRGEIVVRDAGALRGFADRP